MEGHQASAIYLPSVYGADIETERAFQHELHGIVDEMKVKLVDEKKILEGTLNPEYGKADWELPFIPIQEQNELSTFNPTDPQWKRDSQSGFSKIDPIRVSTHDSSILSCTAEHSNLESPTVSLRRSSSLSQISFCSGNSAASGTEIDAMNAYSECTVSMTNEQTHGTPNEGR